MFDHPFVNLYQYYIIHEKLESNRLLHCRLDLQNKIHCYYIHSINMMHIITSAKKVGRQGVQSMLVD